MQARDLWRSPSLARVRRRASSQALRWLPPAVADALRRRVSEWEVLPDGWPPSSVVGEGWNDESVSASQERHWPILVRNLAGPGPLGVSHLPAREARDDPGDQNAVLSFGYVLARAAEGRRRLAILDWGGGLAHYHLYARALAPEITLDYHCHDLARLCRLGSRLQPDVVFHESSSEALARRYDLVLCSSALHYFEDWRSVLRDLASVADHSVYVARLHTIERHASFVVAQAPHSFGYFTRYPSWCLNREDVVRTATSVGLELVREFVFAESWFVRGAPEDPRSRGFLFRARHAGIA